MKKWKFCTNNDYLVSLVLKGLKKATTSNYDINDLPVIGEESIILFSNNKEACIVKTTGYRILQFKCIDENLSMLEGEGPHHMWKKNHIELFKQYDEEFSDESLVIFETFELVKKI